jgi:hypothetical protein
MANPNRDPELVPPGVVPTWNLEDLDFDADWRLVIKNKSLQDAIEKAMQETQAKEGAPKRRLRIVREDQGASASAAPAEEEPRRPLAHAKKKDSAGSDTGQGKTPGSYQPNMMCPCAPEP